jgi:hypothetical protein
MKTIFLLILLLHFSSCQSQEITKIKGFPDEIEGCSCYFAETEQDFKDGKYIYLDQYYQGIAFISIDNKLIRIDLEHQKQSDYKVTIEFDKNENNQNGDETWLQTGTLKVKLKDGTVLKKRFIGECGC